MSEPTLNVTLSRTQNDEPTLTVTLSCTQNDDSACKGGQRCHPWFAASLIVVGGKVPKDINPHIIITD